MFRIIRVSSLAVMLLLAAFSVAAAGEGDTPPVVPTPGNPTLRSFYGKDKGTKKPPTEAPRPPGGLLDGVSPDAIDPVSDSGTDDGAYEQDGLPGESSTTVNVLCGEARACTPRILRAIRERADWGSSSDDNGGECPVDDSECPDGYHGVVIEVCDVDDEGNESGCELIYDCVEDQASSSLEPIGTFAGLATSPLGVTEETSAPKQSEALKGLGSCPLGSRNT